jgi:hypothetical protein
MSVDKTEITSQQVTDVQGQTVRMSQSAAGAVDADRVEMNLSAARTVDADAVEMTRATAQLVESEMVRMNQSLAVGARTETLAVEQSVLGVMRTSDATIADSGLLLLAGDHIQAANVKTLFLFSNSVEGEIKAVLDWRGALAGGAALGVVTTLGLFLLNMLGRSRRA